MKTRHNSVQGREHRVDERQSDEQPVAQDHREEAKGRHAERPREIPKRGWRDILLRTKKEVSRDNLSIVAAGVAFFVLFAIIPALAAVISIYGLVADPADIQRQVASLSQILPPDALQLLRDQMSRIASKSTAAGWGATLGLLLALWSGSKGTKAVITALNIAYEEEEKRGFFKLNLLALAMTLIGVVAVVLAVGLVVALPAVLDKLGLGSIGQTAISVLRWPLLLVLAMTGLAALYRYGPNRTRAKWHWVTWGAGLATLIWIAGSALFSYYVSNFGSYNKTYGSLGAVVILLMWFYLSAYVVLLGAELDSEMEHQTAHDTTVDPPKPMGERGAYVADHLGESP